jgi:hypothetical protein
MHFAVANSCTANDERTVGDCFAESFVNFGRLEKFFCADGGARALEGYVVRMHEAEMREAEIADATRGGADVQGIARINEDDSDVGNLFGDEHRRYSTARGGKSPQWMPILSPENCNATDEFMKGGDGATEIV